MPEEERKKTSMGDQALRIGVSLAALVMIVVHLWKPGVQIDSITVALLVISVLPWVWSHVWPYIKRVQFLWFTLETREPETIVTGARGTAKGTSRQTTCAPKATRTIGQFDGKRVLWVDDNPQNNEHGIRALQAQGIEVVTCKTTLEALKQVESGEFNVIITDQFRREDGIDKNRAGYELLAQLYQSGVKTPVIFSSASPNREEAHSLGFYDTATTQQAVVELALKAIRSA
jgi:CheY-like chemotaxis protein